MKIVATSDTHFPFDPKAVPDGDVFVLAGDLMNEGTPAEWHPRLECLAALPHKHKLFVPGNHDYYTEHFRGLARSQLRREAGVTMVDERDPWISIQGVRFLCLPFVTGLPGWARNVEEEWLYRWLEQATENDTPHVVVSHAPPYRILDACGAENYGALAYNKWLHEESEADPDVWICGHVHESYGRTRVGATDFYNVCMCNEQYKQVNPPMVIEL